MTALHEKMTNAKKPLELDRTFIEKHNLTDLLIQISLLFKEEGVVSPALNEIENMVTEGEECETNAAV